MTRFGTTVLLFVMLLVNCAKAAEKIVLGLSEDQVGITATFDGSEILVFGAVRRDAPVPQGSILDIIITVTGPLTPVTVRRKDRRFGIWVNTEAALIDSAPSFYAVATTRSIEMILREVEDLRYSITIPHAIRSVGNEVTDIDAFTEALISIRSEEGLYNILEGAVSLTDQTLFRSRITLPANIIEGQYDTRIYLTRDGKVIDATRATIKIHKVGLERWLHSLSQGKPFVYGLLTLAVAVLLGWLASMVFLVWRR